MRNSCVILRADRRAGYNHHQSEGRKCVLMALSEDYHKRVLERIAYELSQPEARRKVGNYASARHHGMILKKGFIMIIASNLSIPFLISSPVLCDFCLSTELFSAVLLFLLYLSTLLVDRTSSLMLQ